MHKLQPFPQGEKKKKTDIEHFKILAYITRYYSRRMSREAYTVPTTTQVSSPTRTVSSSQPPSRQTEHTSPQQPAYERLPRQKPRVTYICSACATKVTRNQDERLQCDYCGGWIFHKMKTKSVCQFEAR